MMSAAENLHLSCVRVTKVFAVTIQWWCSGYHVIRNSMESPTDACYLPPTRLSSGGFIMGHVSLSGEGGCPCSMLST